MEVFFGVATLDEEGKFFFEHFGDGVEAVGGVVAEDLGEGGVGVAEVAGERGVREEEEVSGVEGDVGCGGKGAVFERPVEGEGKFDRFGLEGVAQFEAEVWWGVGK